jgi:hypothetical protein
MRSGHYSTYKNKLTILNKYLSATRNELNLFLSTTIEIEVVTSSILSANELLTFDVSFPQTKERNIANLNITKQFIIFLLTI